MLSERRQNETICLMRETEHITNLYEDIVVFWRISIPDCTFMATVSLEQPRKALQMHLRVAMPNSAT
ncbi:hypothetical protein IAQ61_010295 [Plenodomus lingam]|uniref:uncharacterized protein n=1 Tax=Leptosphaeria maculans TaxID=5022 RepID=UPI0033268F73|nr:hypothetical protein IAQ61_010295 [Plenodomus lingam]